MTSGSGPKTSETGNLVLSGLNKNITDCVKDGPLRKCSSNVKDGPNRSCKSNVPSKAPHRKYYEPANDAKTFFVNSHGHLHYHQDPQLIYKPNDKRNPSTIDQGHLYAEWWKKSRSYTQTHLTDVADSRKSTTSR